MNNLATWPDDADGDVLRALESKGFDFGAEYSIDFNVDFEDWPPHPEAIKWLQSRYGTVEVFVPDNDLYEYAHFKIRARLSHTLVRETQAEVTAQLGRFGGVCETWGVLHDPHS
jgi:hypothetical protein